MRVSFDEINGFYSAQSPTANAGIDDVWISLQPGASDAPAAAAAAGPNGGGRPALRRPDSTTASAVSFGFIAIAILISMFLVIAIFERILRPRRHLPPLHHTHELDLEFSQMSQRPLQWAAASISKAHDEHHPTGSSSYGRGVSVVMPGQEIPTFIARPAPISTATTTTEFCLNSGSPA